MRRMRLFGLPPAALAFLSTLAHANAVAAQDRAPGLPRDKDPNDWEAYYDEGMKWIPGNIPAASDFFTWASRIRPDRAEPLYARYVAYWASDLEKFSKYLRGEAATLRDPAVQRAEAMRERALRRNPFVHQGPIVAVYDMLPGRFRDDGPTRAWIALGRAELPRAIDIMARLIERNPQQHGWMRFVRASALVNSGLPDSALSDITALLAQLRAADSTEIGYYASKEMLEYAAGLLHLSGRRRSAARAAFERAVVENAGFAPAHAMLGEMAMSVRDTASAVLAYGLAAETDSSDVEYALGYGKALRQAKRPGDAVLQFRRAISLEPLYAAPYVQLGLSLEEVGDATAAAEAYRKFLDRAARTDPERGRAQRRLEALTAAPAPAR
jgi:tetratricopeptide (TPR) repeat protein